MWKVMVRAGNELVACPKFPLLISELTNCRFARLKRLRISPFASSFILSPKNQGVAKDLVRLKSTFLYPGSSYVFRPRLPSTPRAGAGNWAAAVAGEPNTPVRKSLLL